MCTFVLLILIEMRFLFIFLFIAFCATKLSAQWTNTTSGTNVKLNDVYFLSADTGFVAGGNLTILKTVNGGNSWSQAIIDNSGLISSAAVEKIVFNNEKTIGVATGNFGNGNYFLRSTDKGNTWNKTSQLSAFGINAISFYDNSQVFAVGDSSELFYSSDAGNSWTPYSFNGFNRSITDIFCKNGVCVACLSSGSVYKTNSANGVWTIIKQADSVSLKSIVALNNDTILAIGQAGNKSYLISSYNGGSSWLAPLNMQVDNINDIFFANQSIGFAVGGSPTLGTNSQYIATTNDAGFTWQQQNEITLRQLNSVYFIDALTGYAVGDSGTIIKTTNGGITGIHDKLLASTIKVFPVPADRLLNIVSEKETIENIMVFDIAGKEVIASMKEPSDNSLYQLDITSLPSGFYYLNILFKNGSSTSKKIIRE
jgi:photosystem II stability/assembly factor-like uncharacterized protein